jgi:hypothetical protein
MRPWIEKCGRDIGTRLGRRSAQPRSLTERTKRWRRTLLGSSIEAGVWRAEPD